MDLDSYYDFVYASGKLRTPQHAKRWSDGALRTLGASLSRKTKRALAKELPDELAQSVNGVFWLAHFRDPNQARDEFLQRAARRVGNSDSEFAAIPTAAVFAGLRLFISEDVDRQVAESLSPDLREFWESAGAQFRTSAKSGRASMAAH